MRAQGFTVDGEHDSEDEEDSYVNKCVEVVGRGDSDKEPLKGFVMQDMLVENCGCVADTETQSVQSNIKAYQVRKKSVVAVTKCMKHQQRNFSQYCRLGTV